MADKVVSVTSSPQKLEQLVDKVDLPAFAKETMLVIYMTGKGANHLVSFMFPSETISSLTYLADFEVSRLAGVLPAN